MTNNPHNTDNQSDMSTTTGNSWTPFAAKQGMWTDGTGDTSGFSHIVRLPARIVPLARPFGGDLDAIFDRLFTLVPEVADAPVTTFTDMPTIYIPREHLLKTMQALRDDEELRYELCTSISGVHYPTEKDAELHSVYHLLSMSHNRRLRVEVVCPAAEVRVLRQSGITLPALSMIPQIFLPLFAPFYRFPHRYSIDTYRCRINQKVG